MSSEAVVEELERRIMGFRGNPLRIMPLSSVESHGGSTAEI